MEVYTLGFSNRRWDETLLLLRSFGIRRVVDIRTLPGSRHTPQPSTASEKKPAPEAIPPDLATGD